MREARRIPLTIRDLLQRKLGDLRPGKQVSQEAVDSLRNEVMAWPMAVKTKRVYATNMVRYIADECHTPVYFTDTWGRTRRYTPQKCMRIEEIALGLPYSDTLAWARLALLFDLFGNVSSPQALRPAVRFIFPRNVKSARFSILDLLAKSLRVGAPGGRDHDPKRDAYTLSGKRQCAWFLTGIRPYTLSTRADELEEVLG